MNYNCLQAFGKFDPFEGSDRCDNLNAHPIGREENEQIAWRSQAAQRFEWGFELDILYW